MLVFIVALHPGIQIELAASALEMSSGLATSAFEQTYTSTIMLARGATWCNLVQITPLTFSCTGESNHSNIGLIPEVRIQPWKTRKAMSSNSGAQRRLKSPAYRF